MQDLLREMEMLETRRANEEKNQPYAIVFLFFVHGNQSTGDPKRIIKIWSS